MLAYTPIGLETVVCQLPDKKLQKAGPGIRAGLTSSPLQFGIMRKKVTDSVKTFSTSGKDVLVFPKNLTLDAVFLLNQIAPTFNLILAIGYRDDTLEKPTGYVLCRSGVQSPKCHPRSVYYIVNVSRHASRPKMYDPPLSFHNIVSDYLQQTFHAIGCVQSAFKQGIDECIFKFLPAIHSTKDLIHFSDDYWYSLLLRCFDIRVVRDKKMKEVLENLPATIDTSKFHNHNTWKSATFSEEKLAYWWPSIRKKPHLSDPLSAELRALRSHLTRMMPTTAKLNLCLNAFYPGPNSRLAPHQDDELFDYLMCHEDVACTFTGASRKLAIGPVCQWKSKKMKRFPPFEFNCSQNNVIRMTPIANMLFAHSKLKSKSSEPSHTFTWRQGIPLPHVKTQYPTIYKNLKKFHSL